MIIVENNNRKKYCVVADGKRFYVMPNGRLQTGQSEIRLKRVFSSNRLVDFVIKTLFFLLCVLIVFLDTDFDNGEFLLVFVKYRCKNVGKDLKLTVTSSALLNINKSGQGESKFTIQRKFLIAHVISVVLYSAIVTALFIVLGILTLSESFLSPMFFALAGAAACVSAYMIFLTLKRYKRTINSLNEYYHSFA